MKRKTLVIILVTAVAVLLAGAIAVGASGITVSTGRCVVADSGSVLWISNTGEPTVMTNKGFDKNIFDGLTTGDEILIIRQNAIAESYPGQVVVYSCIKLSDGLEKDIPKSTLDSLRELGWID